MTPKELNLLYETLEHMAEHFYRLGHADGVAGKSAEGVKFALSKARKLEIKTALEKATKTR